MDQSATRFVLKQNDGLYLAPNHKPGGPSICLVKRPQDAQQYILIETAAAVAKELHKAGWNLSLKPVSHSLFSDQDISRA